MMLCADEHGVVHSIISGVETWCGWARVWKGGEWRLVRKKENRVVTCLECVAFADGYQRSKR